MEIRFRSSVVQGPVADRSLFELNHSAEGNVQLGGCLEICWYWTNHVELKLTCFAVDCTGEVLIGQVGREVASVSAEPVDVPVPIGG